MVLGCRSVNCFEKQQLQGEGTYGQVFMALDKASQKVYALKKLRMEKEKEGFPITALRELTILKRMRHPHIVDMVEVVVGAKHESVFLVFEYCEHDLAALLDGSATPPFSEAEAKRILMQLLDAVAYMHEQWVIHRDIKMSNLLYSNGSLKLCDFGLARDFGTPLRPYTPKVVTLWYRAPELLLGAKTYSSAIDLWACGAIMGELLCHAPLLPGRNDTEQLKLTYDLLGAPNDAIWPGYSSLPNAAAMQTRAQPYNNLAQRFPDLSAEGRDMLNSMLTYDPDKRPTGRDALRYDYWKAFPLPKRADQMPTFPSTLTSLGQTAGGRVARKRPVTPGKEEQPAKKRQSAGDRFGLVF
ncbi:kinase-like domain-containing protein [Baffinella frigidus]|nr:kinase-like domain-containing protein [Cryptophyta sp. CCMP2293]